MHHFKVLHKRVALLQRLMGIAEDSDTVDVSIPFDFMDIALDLPFSDATKQDAEQEDDEEICCRIISNALSLLSASDLRPPSIHALTNEDPMTSQAVVDQERKSNARALHEIEFLQLEMALFQFLVVRMLPPGVPNPEKRQKWMKTLRNHANVKSMIEAILQRSTLNLQAPSGAVTHRLIMEVLFNLSDQVHSKDKNLGDGANTMHAIRNFLTGSTNIATTRRRMEVVVPPPSDTVGAMATHGAPASLTLSSRVADATNPVDDPRDISVTSPRTLRRAPRT